ncbi:kinesin family member 25 [Homo sapiens]|uniref:Kinesin family member 25 n=1 Tax=Homo sapiens TaxID=9606 RepID=A0A494C0P5_HUMAN|nr:kinesin family member 25 [Homo sapiens]KAI4020584.1 kinesin family member 25 [Homo sapiens]
MTWTSGQLQREKQARPGSGAVLAFPDDKDLRVYGPAESQSAVFGDVCPLLTSLLDGYNVCVMAYGQTGSGKSYTMLGRHSDDGPVLPLDPQSDLGIIPRVAEELFRAQ